MFQCTANALCFISLGTQEPTVVESDKTTVEVTPIGHLAFTAILRIASSLANAQVLVPGYLSAAWMNLVDRGNGGLPGKT